MYRRITTQMLMALIAAGSLLVAQGAGPAIGLVMAKGTFRIDNAAVTGNGTLFEGTTIETGKVPSSLQLQNGARIELAAASRGKVYSERLILEQGAGLLSGSPAYRVEAARLRVLPAPDSSARVALSGPGRLQVAALSGAVRVTNASGILLANIASGGALEFQPQEAGAAAPTVITGTLEKREGRYFLTDQTSKVTIEIQGPGLDKEVGNCVEITGAVVAGATPAEGAAQVIRMTELKRCGKEAAAAAAGAAGAGTGAALGAGMAAATKAIIVGVVIAGAATGTAVAVTRGEEKPSVSR